MKYIKPTVLACSDLKDKSKCQCISCISRWVCGCNLCADANCKETNCDEYKEEKK